jgi:uncharacterized membrane protein
MDSQPGQPDAHANPPADSVQRRLDDLERRLARLEALAPALKPHEFAEEGPRSAGSESALPPTTTPVGLQPVADSVPPAIRLTPEPTPTAAAPRPAMSPLPAPTGTPVPPLASPPASGPVKRPIPRPAPSKPSVSVEQLIGGKWFLVLGALIVVAGVGFFLKLAYDQGWIGNIPPAMRCVFSGVFGMALIGAGLLSERKLGRFAGVGFTAAGLGVLYATAFAAYAIFELVGPSLAFVMLCAVSALGLTLAVRGRSLLLAVLALAGGYLTPLILVRPDSPAWALPPYLLALMAVGSVLAVRDRRYRPLASIVWWATGILGGMWVTVSGDDAPWLGLGFVAAVWGAVHAVRLRLPDAETQHHRLVAATTSFSTSLWAFGIAWYLADTLGLTSMWLVPAAGASVTALGGLALAGMLDGFRERPRTVGESVGVSLLCQAGAFVPITVAVGIDTAWSQIMVWLLLGLGAVAAGRWARAGSLAWYGAAILGIGTLRVLGEVLGPLANGTVTSVGLVFTWWMALMVAAAASWGACAWMSGRIRPNPDKPVPEHLRVLRVLAGVAAGVLLAALVWHDDATAEGGLLAYLAIGVLGLAIATVRRAARKWLTPASGVYLGLAVLAWAYAFLNSDWYMNRPATPPLLYPGLLWSLPLIVAWAAMGFALARASIIGWERSRFVAWAGALALGLSATTLETARIAGTLTTDATLRDGSVSIWWALVGTGLLAAGFARRAAWLRYGGIGLLLVTTGKVLTWDLAQVSPAVRVACFIAIGLVLLGVAAWYLRAGKAGESQQSQPRA